MNSTKGFNRRDFLKVLGAGTGLAATGCAKDVPEKLIPYVIQPDEIVPGNSVWYAGTCNECSAGCGVLVKTKEGRALKVEGNPKHPVNRGGLCALGQSSVQALYDPDRIREPQVRGVGEAFKFSDWTTAVDLVADSLSKADSAGKKSVFITKPLSGSENKIFQEFIAKFANTVHYEYEVFSNEPLVLASENLFGKGARVNFAFDQADVILGFGADYLETWISPVKFAKDYAARRVPENYAKIKSTKSGHKTLSKVYHVEPRLSLTAANADNWIKNAPNSELGLLKAVLFSVAKKKNLTGLKKASTDSLLKDFSLEEACKAADIEVSRFEKIVEDLLHAESSLVVAGGASVSANASECMTLALAINDILGNVGKSVLVHKVSDSKSINLGPKAVADLVTELKAEKIANVIFVDTNPIYSLPHATTFATALSKATFVVSMSKTLDETTVLANVVLPLSTNFETWSDSEPVPGVIAINQPAMQKLYKTQGLGDIVLSLDASSKNLKGGQFKGITDFKVYLDTEWKKAFGDKNFSDNFTQILSDGGDWSKKKDIATISSADYSKIIDFGKVAKPKSSGFTLMAYPTVHYHDGRGANRSWMQEIPDPMTTAVWGSWIEVHPDLAEEYNFSAGDVIQVKTKNGAVEAPVYITKHIHPKVVATPIGLGHTGYGRYASGIGSNALLVHDFTGTGEQFSLLTSDVAIQPSTSLDKLVLSQFSDSQLQRGFIRGVTEDKFAKSLSGEEPVAHHAGGHHDPLALGPRDEPKQMYKQMEHPVYKWGMSIDLAACTGCSACVAACYAENNIPVVGKQVCDQGREMSWIKIARYLDGPEEHPVTGFAPSLCQHCGNAPCEPVCPVYGTYHSEDGLNTMVYNRCVGTRYCSNNCSYKVRRFNWFEYEWPEPLNWQLNPDVTVRGVGIMEKCSFCIQRIREGQNTAKDEGRLVEDGEILPACASSCPTDAIKFGNLLDKESVVANNSESKRGYKVLDVELNTQPAVTYLAKVLHEELEPPRGHHVDDHHADDHGAGSHEHNDHGHAKDEKGHSAASGH